MSRNSDRHFKTAAAEAIALAAPVDGRQSEAALAIQRGSMRLMASHGLTTLPEFVLASGRRADVIALGGDGRITIIEIKSSVADFRADAKWSEYLDYCDRFFFAVAPDFPHDLIPTDVGLIVADKYGGEALREPSVDRRPLPGARRKVIVLSIARTAMARLRLIVDPDG